MKKNYLIILASLFFSFLLFSCKKPLPQLPSNKGLQTNTENFNLQKINQRLAQKEDTILEIYVKSRDNSFKKNEIGFWYKIEKSENGTKIKASENINISYKLLFLNGIIIQEVEKQNLVLGKKQVVVGLEEGIKLMKKGEKATFIIPWYLAYGMNGKEPLIPPFTSIIYKVEISN
jgi:FKBP-type peptidyl-prolyl cis-trans isomerase